MSTTMVGRTGRYERRFARNQSAGIRIGRLGIGTVGFLTILVSAWGGIIPYVGPVFGYSADGTGSWHWDLADTVLALIPGIMGVFAGMVILGETKGLNAGRGRMSLSMAGFIAVLCGAWFVIGPSAWPVITTSGGYFVPASPLHELANVVGYSLGTGVILASLGGFAIGWAARHQPTPTEYVEQDAPVTTPAMASTTASTTSPSQSQSPSQQPLVQQNTPPIV